MIQVAPIRMPIKAAIWYQLNVLRIRNTLHRQKIAVIGKAIALVIMDMLESDFDKPKMKSRFSVKSQSAG